MVHVIKYGILLTLFWVFTVTAVPSKQFLNEELGNDPIFISKISDRELISLLEKSGKGNLDDELNVAKLPKRYKNKKSKKIILLPETENESSGREEAYFKLNNKKVGEPINLQIEADPSFLAHQKVKNLLDSHQIRNHANSDSDESDENKELLFDILIAQLKKLCCNSNKSNKKRNRKPSYEPVLKNMLYDTKNPFKYEQMFLILNDEIKGDKANLAPESDIMYVDPESLNENSSVLLLGPITSPLNNDQLKTVMDRLTQELSQPEYQSLLRELSEGKPNTANTNLIKSLISGSNTRRYIKPHRCNYRYPQSLNPKWLVCTGYLNINTPSLYD